MRLLELIIKGKKLEICRNLLGKETVLIDNKIVSHKQTFSGTSHNIEIEGQNYELKYKVKKRWKGLFGSPTFEINSDGALLSEHEIKNKSFITIQFLIGLIITFCTYLILKMLIEAAQNGFFYNEY
jgi:hypothetical protein